MKRKSPGIVTLLKRQGFKDNGVKFDPESGLFLHEMVLDLTVKTPRKKPRKKR